MANINQVIRGYQPGTTIINNQGQADLSNVLDAGTFDRSLFTPEIQENLIKANLGIGISPVAQQQQPDQPDDAVRISKDRLEELQRLEALIKQPNILDAVSEKLLGNPTNVQPQVNEVLPQATVTPTEQQQSQSNETNPADDYLAQLLGNENDVFNMDVNTQNVPNQQQEQQTQQQQAQQQQIQQQIQQQQVNQLQQQQQQVQTQDPYAGDKEIAKIAISAGIDPKEFVNFINNISGNDMIELYRNKRQQQQTQTQPQTQSGPPPQQVPSPNLSEISGVHSVPTYRGVTTIGQDVDTFGF